MREQDKHIDAMPLEELLKGISATVMPWRSRIRSLGGADALIRSEQDAMKHQRRVAAVLANKRGTYG